MPFDFSQLRKQPIDFKQVRGYLVKAAKTNQTAKKIIKENPDIAFKSAYDSLISSTLALMLSMGFRTGSQKGHHKIMVKFAKEILGTKFNSLTSTYNQMRSKRQKLVYEPVSVSETDARGAVITAEKFLVAVEQKISEINPQQKLLKP